jgi:hypothetical protein
LNIKFAVGHLDGALPVSAMSLREVKGHGLVQDTALSLGKTQAVPASKPRFSAQKKRGIRHMPQQKDLKYWR